MQGGLNIQIEIDCFQIALLHISHLLVAYGDNAAANLPRCNRSDYGILAIIQAPYRHILHKPRLLFQCVDHLAKASIIAGVAAVTIKQSAGGILRCS